MKISEQGIKFIKEEEGLRTQAYLCPGNKWTIGYGHTKGVQEGQSVTEQQAEDFLREDLVEAEEVVKEHVRVPLSQGQFDALVSFVFNLGAGHFTSSTLLRLLNNSQYKDAADELSRWVYADGKKLLGLVRRRAKEKKMFWPTDEAEEPIVVAQPTLERKEHKVVPALIPVILTALQEAIPVIGRLFTKSKVAERNVQLAEKVIEISTQVAGAVNAQEMIEKVQSDPVVRAKVENEVQLQWYSLLEVGGGIEEGHRFAVELAKQEVKLWQMPVFWITVLLLPLVYMTLGAVLFRDVFTAELRAMVVGAIMTGALGGVVAYWFNTTFGSARKTDIMAEKQK